MGTHHQNKRYAVLNRKSTHELLEIWSMHDEKMWSEDAFFTIKQILLERQINIPEPSPLPESSTNPNIVSTKKSSSSLKEKFERFCHQQSYLIAYIAFTALTTASAWLLSFFGIPPLIRLFLAIAINYGVFIVVIQRYILPYQ